MISAPDVIVTFIFGEQIHYQHYKSNGFLFFYIHQYELMDIRIYKKNINPKCLSFKYFVHSYLTVSY